MDQREFAERVTAVQGSLYRVAASYLRGESDRLDAVAGGHRQSVGAAANPSGGSAVRNVDNTHSDSGLRGHTTAAKAGDSGIRDRREAGGG